jgi:S-formylglutathione hydrolase FrmB
VRGRARGRRVAAFAVGALAASCWCASATAQQLVTWTTTSRYVDPARTQFNSPPPGVAGRPAALRVNVLLPDGYDGQRRFPVLYLLHGHGDAYDYWVNPQKGDLLEIAKGFSGIIVMPEAATGWYTNWWDGGARGADGRGWERYHLDELIPLVESRLKILPGRSNHAIAGLSMGGEGAIFYAEQRPGYFGSAATFSGVLSMQRPEWPTGFDTQGQNHLDVYGDPQAQSFYWAGHNPTALVDALRWTRVFVRVGDGVPLPLFSGEATNFFGAVAEAELSQHGADFASAARGVGVDVTYEPTTGVHDWPYWRLALQSALKWGFFRPVPEAPASWSYQTVAQSGRAWDVEYSFAEAPAVLETFARDGDRLSATGSGVVTVTADGRPPFTAALPFDRVLPAAIPSTKQAPSGRARRGVSHHRRGAVGHHRRGAGGQGRRGAVGQHRRGRRQASHRRAVRRASPRG